MLSGEHHGPVSWALGLIDVVYGSEVLEALVCLLTHTWGEELLILYVVDWCHGCVR